MTSFRFADPVTSEAYGSKDELSNLNSQLAEYIRNVRDLRVASVRNMGTSHYFETLEKMENELMRMRGAYEAELDRMRKECKDTNTRYQAMSQSLQAERSNMKQLRNRLEEVENECDTLRDDITMLRTRVAGKDREIALYKEEMATVGELAGKFKERQNAAETSRTSVEKRLSEETQRRLEAEENVNQLQEKLIFMKQQQAEHEEEFQNRLKASHNMITMLDNKLGELSKMGYDQLPELLQKIREMTAADMRHFHQETESNLNKTIDALKRQMEHEEKEKRAIDQDKQVLKHLAGGLEETNKDLHAQVYSLRQQNAGLKMDLEDERKNSNALVAAHQQRQRELQDELLSKAREFAQAREAQAELKAEIETYKELLSGEQSSLRGSKRKDFHGSLPELDRVPPPSQRVAPKAPSIPDFRLPDPAGQPSLLARQQQQRKSRADSSVKPAGAPPGYPRHWGHLKDPSAGPFLTLPPIGHGQSNLDGVLDTSRSEPATLNKWSRFETTYKRSFSPDNPYRQKTRRQ